MVKEWSHMNYHNPLTVMLLLLLAASTVNAGGSAVMDAPAISAPAVSAVSFDWNDFYAVQNQAQISRTTLLQKVTAAVAESAVRGEYAVFANSPEQYAELTSTFNTVATYPYLRAAKLLATATEAKLLQQLYPRGVIPANLFTKVQLPPEVESTATDNSLGLDAAEDADLMHVSELWDLGYNGTGVVVGVFDNGVDFTHPALANAKFAQKSFALPGYPIVRTHGTPVAGTIAADGTGASPDVTSGRGNAFGAKIASAEMGSHNLGFLMADFLGGFNWLLSMPEIDVINLSWGGGSDVWTPIFERFDEENIVIVASAGNEGNVGSTVSDPFTVGAPSSNPLAISVAANDHSKKLSDFSSEGPGGPGMGKPDVTAPGTSVYSTNAGGGYGTHSGTSFSSPLTAGAVATLISALEANNVNWTSGVIKAALLRSAYNINLPETMQGQGHVDAKAAYDYLMSLPRDANNVPKAFDVTPKYGVYKYFQDIPQQVITSVPLTLIVSDFADLDVTLSSNLASFISVAYDTSVQTTIIKLTVDTLNNNVPLGAISGTLTATLAGDSIEIPLSFTILPAPTSRIYVDQYYTNADEMNSLARSSSNLGAFIYAATQRGSWVEFGNQEFNSVLLNQFSSVVMYYPFAIDEDGILTTTPPISAAAITALDTYVQSGKSLFFSFDPPNTFAGSLLGSNETIVDSILHRFDMDAYYIGDYLALFPTGTPPSEEITFTNTTGLQRNVESVSQSGMGLHILNSSTVTPIISSDTATTFATYQDGTSGRVVVSTDTSWMSATYVLGPNAKPDAAQFLSNLVDYLTVADRVEVIYDTSTVEHAAITVRVIGSVVPVGKVYLDGNFNATPIVTALGGGLYSVSYEFQYDGIYSVAIAVGGDYYQFNILRDFTGPLIISVDGPQYFQNANDYGVFRFNVIDLKTSFLTSDFNVTIDHAVHDSITIRYNPTLKLLIVSFTIGSVVNMSVANHTIEVAAKDNYDNIGSLEYQFFIGEEPVTSTSSSSTTSTTTTTTPSTSSSTPTKDTPLFFLPVVFSVAVAVFKRRQR